MLSSSVLTFKAPRKVVPLTPAQAYSRLFCQRGSELHAELKGAWKLYVSSDQDTLDEYGHLFTAHHKQNMCFVTFQQVVLRARVTTTATQAELAEVTKHINDHFEKQKELVERPWKALVVDDSQSQLDLERKYIEE